MSLPPTGSEHHGQPQPSGPPPGQPAGTPGGYPASGQQGWGPGYNQEGQPSGGPGYVQPGQPAGAPGHNQPVTKPKKPIFKRVWFWILVVIAVIVIANLAGGGDDGGSSDAEPTTAAQDDATDATEPADETATEPADDAAAEEDGGAEGTNAVVGEPVAVDDWEVTVLAVGEPVETVGPDMFNTEAQGIFIPVQLRVTNNANQAEFFFADNFVLVDDQGREFSYSSDATIYGASDGAVSLLDEINPGNTLEGILYYDVPADATVVAMKVSGGLFTTPVTIALS